MNIEKILKRDETDGSHFQNVYLITTLRKLRDELGSESFMGSGDNKVTHEWAFIVTPDVHENDGFGGEDRVGILTVYDYKEDETIELDQEVQWHIGGRYLSQDDIIKFLCDHCFTGDYKLA